MSPTRIAAAAGLSLLAVVVCAGQSEPADVAVQAKVVAFVGVNVVPMDTERVIDGQTVIVREGRIAEIGPAATTKVPEGTLRIAGRGKYLMPGLADMHAHLDSPHNPGSDEDLLLYVANGVTTVRNPWGTEKTLRWRERIANGELLGPTIYTTGPIMDGNPPLIPGAIAVETAADAERVVAEQKKAGFDFIKVYSRLTPEAYDGLVTAAKKYGLPVTGHVPHAVGLERALASGQSLIDHLIGYAEALQRDDSPLRERFNRPVNAEEMVGSQAIDYLDDAKLPAVAKATRDAGVWNCPTMVTFQKWTLAETEWRTPEMKYVPPRLIASWERTMKTRLTARSQSGARQYEFNKKMTKALRDAGARLLLGSDTRNPFVVPGFSVHNELRHLVDAGLSAYEAIEAGTRGPAEFLGGRDEFGTIAPGRRADLILVNGNPLDDVAHVARPSGVMVRGRWLPAVELQRMLDTIAAAYRSKP